MSVPFSYFGCLVFMSNLMDALFLLISEAPNRYFNADFLFYVKALDCSWTALHTEGIN